MKPFSHRSYEGELLVDNRVSGGRRVECATLCCSHCQASIIVNPLRTRERNYCRSCNAYICDQCSLLAKLGHQHESFSSFADRYLNAAAKGKELPKWPSA